MQNIGIVKYSACAEFVRSVMYKCFREHPMSVGETYLQHCVAALAISWQFSRAAIAAFVHAFLPCWFQSTATGIAKEIIASVASRQKRSD